MPTLLNPEEVDVVYVKDIVAWMKVKEDSMVPLKLLSPQLHRRRSLVEWSCSMAEKLKLTTQTVHLAINLVDHFMAGHDIEVVIRKRNLSILIFFYKFRSLNCI